MPVTTSPVSFFATSLLAHGGMGLATQISCTDASQKMNSSDHGIIPSAPPPVSPGALALSPHRGAATVSAAATLPPASASPATSPAPPAGTPAWPAPPPWS